MSWTSAVRSSAARASAGVLLAGALALLSVGLLAPATPAAAHNVLVSSVPEDGARVDQSPDAIELEYNEVVSTEYAQVAVTGSDGNPWQQGDPRVEGGTVTQPVKPLPDDTYTVAWRVVSSDGHPIDGSYEFQVGTGEPAPDGSDDSDGSAATGGSAADPTEEASGAPWLWPLVGVVGALVVVAAVLGGVVRARESARRRRSTG